MQPIYFVIWRAALLYLWQNHMLEFRAGADIPNIPLPCVPWKSFFIQFKLELPHIFPLYGGFFSAQCDHGGPHCWKAVTIGLCKPKVHALIKTVSSLWVAMNVAFSSGHPNQMSCSLSLALYLYLESHYSFLDSLLHSLRHH